MTTESMCVGGAVLLAWGLYAGREFVCLSRAAQGTTRVPQALVAGGVGAALGAVLAIELAGSNGAAALWGQVALTAGAAAAILLDSWLGFRVPRFALSFLADFAMCFCATSALVGVLVLLAIRLYPLAPFGALLVGTLSFLVAVNALAEVFHEGAKGRQGKTPMGKSREHR